MERALFEKGQKRGGASRPIEGGKYLAPARRAYGWQIQV